LRSRGWAASRAAADALAGWGVTADAVSLAGLGAALAAGALMAATPALDASWTRAAWIAAALLVAARLSCNLLDGMVAERRGGGSPVGEMLNEVPDRLSDMAILLGLGFAAGGEAAWGLAAALAAVTTAYVRLAGKWLAGRHDFAGPFAKQQRMATVILACLASAAAPAWAATALGAGLPTAALMLVTAGAAATAARRLVRLRRALLDGAWGKEPR